MRLPRCSNTLQWGRDEGVAEDADRTVTQQTSQLLQWGRDEGVAEDGNIGSITFNNLELLQWGRDEGVAEDGRPPVSCKITTCAVFRER
jgi:hypothetical protein